MVPAFSAASGTDCLGGYAGARVSGGWGAGYLPGEVTAMRDRIAALTGAGVMIAALGAAVPAAASAEATSLPAGRTALAAAQASTTCGFWRWPVKTGSDATRYQVSRTTWYTGVNYLDSLMPPSSFGTYAQDHRIKWPEFHTWQINDTTLVAIKLEDDGDLHLRLSSSTGKTMIAEIPQPGCVSSSSLWKTGITAARNYVTGRYWVSLDRWHYLYKKIDIKGLGFFDEEHGVTGAAPNQIELHP